MTAATKPTILSDGHDPEAGPAVQISDTDAATAVLIIQQYWQQDHANIGKLRYSHRAFIDAILQQEAAANAPAPSRLSRPLPDDLSTLSLVQVSLHDNWGSDTKPRGRASKGKSGRPREKATRYAVTVQAWDQPGASITLRQDFGYHLIGDLYDAEEFRAKALDLRNLVEHKDGTIKAKKRNLNRHVVPEAVAEEMLALSLAHSDPAYRFAILHIPKKRSGCPFADFQFVRLKLGTGGVVEDAHLQAAGGALALPEFSRRQSSGDPFDPASRVVSQARYASPSVTGFTGWATK